MPDPASPAPTPDPIPETVSEVKKDWPWILIILLLIGWILAGFAGYSWKQTSDKLTQMQNEASHSEVVSEPVTVVNGKVYYKTITVRDTQTQTVTVHDKTQTVIRSGVSLGLGYSTSMKPTAFIDADLFPIGPGNIQVWATANSGEQVAGGAYRFNF